jgi:hypothetical protein
LALTTENVALTGAWLLVSDGDARFIAQIKSVAVVAVHVGAAAPAEDAPHIVLAHDGDRSVALDGLTGEKIYARAAAGDAGAITIIRG